MKKIYIILSVACLSPVFLFTYVRSQALSSIKQANQIILSINSLNSSLTETELTQKKEEIDKVLFWLQKIPNLPQMPYQNSQIKLQEIQQISADIDQEFTNNLKAKDTLGDAQKSVNSLGRIDFNVPQSLSYWQNAQDILRQAIQSLGNIPDNISEDIQTQVKDALGNYESLYSQVSKALEWEQKALGYLSKAENFAQQASDILAEIKPDITALESAKSNMNEAINILRDIPSQTSIAINAQAKIPDYEQTLNSISERLEEAIINACPYSYEDFHSAISTVASQNYAFFESVAIAEGEAELEKITIIYEDPKCENVRSQVRNSLLSAWQSHYNKEFNQASSTAGLGSSISCINNGYNGCTEYAELEKQEEIRRLNEERREKISTIQSRLSQ